MVQPFQRLHRRVDAEPLDLRQAVDRRGLEDERVLQLLRGPARHDDGEQRQQDGHPAEERLQGQPDAEVAHRHEQAGQHEDSDADAQPDQQVVTGRLRGAEHGDEEQDGLEALAGDGEEADDALDELLCEAQRAAARHRVERHGQPDAHQHGGPDPEVDAPELVSSPGLDHVGDDGGDHQQGLDALAEQDQEGRDETAPAHGLTRAECVQRRRVLCHHLAERLDVPAHLVDGSAVADADADVAERPFDLGHPSVAEVGQRRLLQAVGLVVLQVGARGLLQALLRVALLVQAQRVPGRVDDVRGDPAPAVVDLGRRRRLRDVGAEQLDQLGRLGLHLRLGALPREIAQVDDALLERHRTLGAQAVLDLVLQAAGLVLLVVRLPNGRLRGLHVARGVLRGDALEERDDGVGRVLPLAVRGRGRGRAPPDRHGQQHGRQPHHRPPHRPTRFHSRNYYAT